MDPITHDELDEAILAQSRMRTGRSIGRTLYLEIPGHEEKCIGILDSPYLAAKLAALWNSNLGR